MHTSNRIEEENKDNQIGYDEQKQDSFSNEQNKSSFSNDFKSSGNESEAKTRNENSNSVIQEKVRPKLPESKISNFPINTLIKKEKEKHPASLKKFKFRNLKNDNLKIKNEKKRMFKIMKLIDVICVLVDLFCVTILYFDHFSLVRNHYQFTTKSNHLRLACLGLSLMVVLLLIKRTKLTHTDELLTSKLKESDLTLKKIIHKNLLFCLIFHLIQPYPYINLHWQMEILGIEITYSIDMILFVLSILRFVSFFEIFSFWYVFTSERSKRIYNLLKGSSLKDKINWGFSLRVTNKHYNLMCLIPIFLIVIYLYALIFKTFEDFDPNGVYTRFNNIENCLWYIIVTMTTIGYGDYTPVTMVGRIIIVTCCIVGVFIISLIFSSFVVFTNLENSEQSAFDKIEYFSMKEQKNNEVDNYINEFIRYKVNKFSKTNRISVNSLIQKYKLDVKRKRVIQQISKKENKEKKILDDFTNAISTSWMKVDEYMVNFDQFSPQLLSKSDQLKDDGPILTDELKSSQKLSFQIYNLAKFYNNCGGLLEITDIDVVNNKKMIQSEKLDKAINSFIKIYKDNKTENSLENETGIINKFDEFYNLEHVKNLQNKSPAKTIANNADHPENILTIKSSIITKNHKASENPALNELIDFNLESKDKQIELGVIDEEELSDWDN